MAGTRRLLAILTASLSLAASTPGSRPGLVGVIAQANHASVGSQSASEGTTIYDGDLLSTDAEGTLELLIGQAVLHLAARSSVVLHGSGEAGASRFDAELLSGTAGLSVPSASFGEIVACSARVRSMPQTRGSVRVEILGPRELWVYAQRGAAEISYRGETEIVPEGKAVHVMLNAEEDGQSGAATKKATKRSKMILVVATAAGAAVAAVVAVRLTVRQAATESPDHP